MFNLTPVVRNIIIVSVVVFIAQNFAAGINLTAYLSLWDFNSGLFRPYQFLTYMFAHGGLWHIFFNMYALSIFAPNLESYWGDRKFLTFYLATGIGAGVIYGATNFFVGGGGSMLGASGAIYGVLMAIGMEFPDMEIRPFGIFSIRAKYFVFVVGILTYVLDRSGTVAHVAHFGGAFVAFVLISIWRSQGRKRR